MKRQTNQSGAAIAVILLLGLLVACEEGTKTSNPAGPGYGPEMVVEPDLLLLEPGDTYTLEARALRDPARDWGEGIIWTSSNPEIVQVTAPGEVTAMGLGDAFVVAEMGEGVSAEALIVVVEDADAAPRHYRLLKK